MSAPASSPASKSRRSALTRMVGNYLQGLTMDFPPKRNSILLICGLLFVNALALSPLLMSGYFADDTLNSQIRGHMIQRDLSLWGVIVHYSRLWFDYQGRIFPLAFCITYSIFYALTNVFFYKLCVLGVVLASIAAFFLLLRTLSGSVLIPSLATMLLPVVFQFRAVWDPILSFSGLYPLISFLLFASMSLFLRVLDKGERRALWLSTFIFLCCCLIFEISYMMFLVYIAIAFLRLRNVKSAIGASWPFVAVTACLATTSILLRSQVKITGTYSTNLNAVAVTKAYLVQMFGTVPLSYFLLDPQHVFASASHAWPIALLQVLPLVMLLVVSAIWMLRNRMSAPITGQAVGGRGVVLFGAILLGVPPILISLSPRYQAQTWGDAYLPVYVSSFGFCLLGAVVVNSVFSWANRRHGLLGGRIVLAALGAWVLLFALNFRNNWLVVQTDNGVLWEPRVLAESALAHGLLNGIAPNATLLVSGVDPWDNADEYSQQTGLKLAVYGLNETRDLTPVFQSRGAACNLLAEETVCDMPPDAPIYTLAMRHLTGGTGAVLLANVRRTFQRRGVVHGLFSEGEILAYFRMPSSGQPLTAAIAGRNVPDGSERGGGGLFRVPAGAGLRVLKEGDGWKLVSLQHEGPFDALSLRGEISAEPTGSSVLLAKDPRSFELRAAGPELLHVGYEARDLGNGVEYPPVILGSDVAIELLVTPAAVQVPNADILSNHAGDSTGFCIEQVGPKTNHYAFTFGSGKSWMEVGTFELSPGRRNYISLQMNNREALLYVNGARVADKALPASPAESAQAIRVGNWVGGERRFSGRVEEVLIAQKAKPETMILQDSKRLLTTAPNDLGKSLLSKGDGSSLIHEGVDPAGSKSHILPTTLVLPESFTLELLVKPGRFQAPYATIISNHPGEKNFQGFTIEQPANKINWYSFCMGNGRTWAISKEFYLSPETLHYLVVAKQRRQASVYLDGQLLEVLEGDLAVSAFPVTVGNWGGKNRPFSGAIQELRIMRSVASARSVAEQAGKLRNTSAQ